ncbi:hypothetical protein [Vibrio maerlii]|uniref:hypothetical protein n=1 Tax=Vibrio maerlii TaxID=2231648 RepID=UPI000E3B5876|nr:hypothetical protein [Vibrio maerlii]
MDVAPYANKLAEYFTIQRKLITEKELVNELTDASEEYLIVNEVLKDCAITRRQYQRLQARVPKLRKSMLQEASTVKRWIHLSFSGPAV